MKKLLNKKVAAMVVALLLALGVCDLTLLEKSNLKPILESLQDSASSLFDDQAPETTKPLIQGANTQKAE